ncbi:MAG TPA: dipeptide epimerase [Steroidobacteraceae bacterium]|jgi:L-alanine-DL-glutamate epimerase-like enolase superfamily enzyme|nr:dipeptide epimerase [Steroidobacteraceae bacterium]
MRLEVVREKIPLSAPFTITGYTFTDVDAVVVHVADGGATGSGEAAGVYYLDDGVEHMCAEIERVRADVEAGVDRESLRRLLPPGGARNAIDCALWDLESKRLGQPAWRIAGLERPRPLLTTFTIPAGDPASMAAKAVEYAQAKQLKLKLTGELSLDAERVRAVRRARPDCWLGVDANQGYSAHSLASLMPDLVAAQVKLVEQPFARGRDAELDGFRCPIPVAADESVQGLSEIEPLVGRFDVVNIKLDKCGGLTEGLAMAAEARRHGLGVMVGNMVGSSLAMAPAWLLGQLCDINDLDGTLFVARDRTPAMVFERGKVSYPDGGWGSPA